MALVSIDGFIIGGVGTKGVLCTYTRLLKEVGPAGLGGWGMAAGCGTTQLGGMNEASNLGPCDRAMDHDQSSLDLFASESAASPSDKLTGLASYQGFQARLAELYQLQTESVGIVLVNPDDLRSFNQEFGPEAGDAVLQGIAQAIQGSIRSRDFAARTRGGEFAVLLPNAEAKDTEVVAERIRRVVQLYPWPLRQVTVCVGFAWAWSGRPDASKLVELADRSLLVAKQRGCNQLVCWTSLPEAA